MEAPMRVARNLRQSEIALLTAAGLLMTAAPGQAQAAPLFGGFYAALGGGAVGLEDTQLDYGGALPNSDVRFDAGWAVSGAVGWRVLDYYRLEFEISHRENDVLDVDPGFFSDGTMRATTYMVNGYVDLPVYSYSGVVPYIGAGIGRAQFTQNIQVSGGTVSDSSSHAFAYQAIGGLEFPLIPRRMSTTFEYRYLSTTRPLFQDLGGFYYHSDYSSHTFLVGLRWAF
jgi:opacity protein-like surface antigen